MNRQPLIVAVVLVGALGIGSTLWLDARVDQLSSVLYCLEDRGDMSTLHRAVSRCPEAVGGLLEAGADPNAATEYGATPLHYAVSAGDPEIVLLLLEHGANPEAVMEGGQTPLEVAHSLGRSEIAEILNTVQSEDAR